MPLARAMSSVRVLTDHCRVPYVSVQITSDKPLIVNPLIIEL